MLIELGTPHATDLPDAARRFGPNKCAPSECSCPFAPTGFSGGVCSTLARFCWITVVQFRNHLANSLFSSILRVMDCFRPLCLPQSFASGGWVGLAMGVLQFRWLIQHISNTS